MCCFFKWPKNTSKLVDDLTYMAKDVHHTTASVELSLPRTFIRSPKNLTQWGWTVTYMIM